MQGISVGLDAHHVRSAAYTAYGFRGVVDLHVGRGRAGRDHLEIVHAIFGDAHQPWTLRRTIGFESESSVGRSFRRRDLSHPLHGIYKGDVEARGGLAGGAVRHGASDVLSER